MRLKTIRVIGLFGLFAHEIPLRMNERITIVHGPNGYGKTIMLRMVAGLLGRHYAVFHQVPFDVFSLEFDDGRTLMIRRLPNLSPREHIPLSGTMN